MVQIMAKPPTEAATAMSTVITVLLAFESFVALPLGVEGPVGPAAFPWTTDVVLKTVEFSCSCAAPAFGSFCWVGGGEVWAASDADVVLLFAGVEVALAELSLLEFDKEFTEREAEVDAEALVEVEEPEFERDSGLGSLGSLGLPTTLMIASAASPRAGKGDRFLIKRLRLAWFGWFASTEVTARVRRTETMSVRETVGRLGNSMARVGSQCCTDNIGGEGKAKGAQQAVSERIPQMETADNGRGQGYRE
jgi:hypothetical protein